MKDAWLLLGTLVVWIVLNRWILPSFGIQTCMSGGCATGSCSSAEPTSSDFADKDVVETKGNQL
jgi:hypothetical protein